MAKRTSLVTISCWPCRKLPVPTAVAGNLTFLPKEPGLVAITQAGTPTHKVLNGPRCKPNRGCKLCLPPCNGQSCIFEGV
jgi:hypothetical protein